MQRRKDCVVVRFGIIAERKDNTVEEPKTVLCPDCGEAVWDVAFASKLNKCWNCGLAFDTEETDEDNTDD